MTRLQMAAAWLKDAQPGDKYIYHIGRSLAADREKDKELDRVARALALAAGMELAVVDEHASRIKPQPKGKRKPAKVSLFSERRGKLILYCAKRLNDPEVSDFVQTADPRVPAYGCRNRGSAGAPGKSGMVRRFS